ncbi:MAG: GspE/PulE family protein [Candidatus Adiutrix sp.]|nr:GspE/PulE family protein [Candidatus Adiutrix sp.]
MTKYSKFTIEYLLDLLLHNGWIGQEQARGIKASYLESISVRARARGGGKGAGGAVKPETSSDPLEYVIGLKLPVPGDTAGRIIGDDALARLMAAEAGLEYRRVEQRDLDLELVTSILPHSFAARHLVLPLGLAEKQLEVAVRHPFYQTILEDVRRVASYPIKPVIVPDGLLKKLLQEIYAFQGSVAGAEHMYAGGSPMDLGNLEQFVKLKSASEIGEDDQHIKNLVGYLLTEGLNNRASDIHIEPKRNDLLVRMRHDGVLHDIHHLPKVLHPAVVSRIKTISRLDIAEKRRPQDGRIKIAGRAGEAEVRVSTVPVAFGEKVVMRILDPEALFMRLEDMFFNQADLAKWNQFTAQPHGIILVTGPTGSGKTTTLYSTLRQLATPSVNVTTVEDPIEMIHEEFNQIAVQPKIGITFGSIIRNILRQDPDIIMIGEMRDHETAENAIQAALTGHLVLSTLHTNDAPSAVTRLIDLGLEPFLVSSTVVGIMAQRLVRRICKYCVDEFVLTEAAALELGFITQGDLSLKRGRGCEMCRNTGYLGRAATVEVMPMSETIQQMALKDGVTAAELKLQARREGMITLRENALDLMLSGITTIEEVMRVTASDE